MYSKQESFATFSEVLIVLYRWCVMYKTQDTYIFLRK